MEEEAKVQRTLLHVLAQAHFSSKMETCHMSLTSPLLSDHINPKFYKAAVPCLGGLPSCSPLNIWIDDPWGKILTRPLSGGFGVEDWEWIVAVKSGLQECHWYGSCQWGQTFSKGRTLPGNKEVHLEVVPPYAGPMHCGPGPFPEMSHRLGIYWVDIPCL